MKITEDMHIHSTFSDGAGTVEENVQAAIAAGMTKMCCVDHVRRDTDWLPSYVKEVRRIREIYGNKIEILIGIEAKFLNQSGDLDMPELPEGIDRILAADHRFPIADEVVHPKEVAELVDQSVIDKRSLFRFLTDAIVNSMEKHPNLVIAHFLSILPKVHLEEKDYPEDMMEEISVKAMATNGVLEMNERWKCPSGKFISYFEDRGNQIIFGTDSHSPGSIGKFEWIESQRKPKLNILEELSQSAN